MNLLAQQHDPKIPFSLLMVSLALGFREEIQAQMLRPVVRHTEPASDFEVDRSGEEPERWDGMS